LAIGGLAITRAAPRRGTLVTDADTGRSLAERFDRFDIAQGGPFVELQARFAILREKAATAPRRAALYVAIAFIVPLLVTVLTGTAWGPLVTRPFLLDWGVWARFVVAIAILVLMERLVAERLKAHLRQFVETPLLAPGAMPAAGEALARALRRRDSAVAEIVCVVLAYAATLVGAYAGATTQGSSWLSTGAPGAEHLSVAGWYVALVSGPLFWFLLLRWLWRHLVWALLLYEISRLELRLVVTHPDGVGGLAFIGQYPNAFSAMVLAMSCVLAAAIAKAFQQDALELTAYGYMMAAWLITVLLLFGVPLLAFRRPLGRLKQQALLASSAAATRHFRAAERAALGGNLAAATDADATAVGDIPNPTATYTAAKKLRTIAFSREALLPVATAAILPLVAAGSTRLPFAELWKIAKKLLLL
jgi:hypothetical protein